MFIWCVRVLDIVYNKRPIQRFWFLEVVARMPYFSYISMLHLYESLGWWRAGAELRRVCGSLVIIVVAAEVMAQSGSLFQALWQPWFYGYLFECYRMFLAHCSWLLQDRSAYIGVDSAVHAAVDWCQSFCFMWGGWGVTTL